MVLPGALVVLAERHLHLGALLAPWSSGGSVHEVAHPCWLFGPYLIRGAVDLTLAATTSFPVVLCALGV